MENITWKLEMDQLAQSLCLSFRSSRLNTKQIKTQYSTRMECCNIVSKIYSDKTKNMEFHYWNSHLVNQFMNKNIFHILISIFRCTPLNAFFTQWLFQNNKHHNSRRNALNEFSFYLRIYFYYYYYNILLSSRQLVARVFAVPSSRTSRTDISSTLL